MNRRSGSGSGPFLMEMLVVVGFFILCASICVSVFAKADRLSRDADRLNHAVLGAQSVTEEIKAGRGKKNCQESGIRHGTPIRSSRQKRLEFRQPTGQI